MSDIDNKDPDAELVKLLAGMTADERRAVMEWLESIQNLKQAIQNLNGAQMIHLTFHEMMTVAVDNNAVGAFLNMSMREIQELDNATDLIDYLRDNRTEDDIRNMVDARDERRYEHADV